MQWVGGFFYVCKVWKKAKKVLPLTTLMGTNDLQGCWARNKSQLPWACQVLQPFYKLAEERSTPKGIFSDKFQLLPLVAPALNLTSSSIQMHRTEMHLQQNALEKLTVHQTCWIWTTPEIKLSKNIQLVADLQSVNNTTEILTVACLCLAFRSQINSHARKGTKWKEWLLTSSRFR